MPMLASNNFAAGRTQYMYHILQATGRRNRIHNSSGELCTQGFTIIFHYVKKQLGMLLY